MRTFQMLIVYAAFVYGAVAYHSVHAGTLSIADTEIVLWQAGVDGIEIGWDNDGRVKHITSRHSVPVEFPDRRGISKAQTIAEEKAKAGIVRFMSQNITSTRIVGELQADLHRANQQRELGKGTNVKKIDERTVVESLMEITTSFAQGSLRGLVILERGYDEKREEAWVVVGLSERTMGASRNLRQSLDGKRNTPNQERGIRFQDGEVRQVPQKP